MSRFAIQVRDLTVFLEGRTGMRRVLDSVEIDVRAGRAFALLGESGSGKTCLVQSVLGIHPGLPGVVKGSAKLFGQEVFGDLGRFVEFSDGDRPAIRKDIPGWNRAVSETLKDVLGSEITLVPQDAGTAMSPFHNVGKLLEMAVRRGDDSLTQEQARSMALEWLNRIQMYDVESVSRRYVHELSGGMAQRVAIALALAPGPSLVIADEPTTGLDATLRIQLIALLASMVKDEGATLVLVTHDMGAARVLANDVAVLYAGMVVETGPVEKVLDMECPQKHPYTHYLLEAEGCLSRGDEMPKASRGEPLDFGCPYAAKCSKAIEICRESRPTLKAQDGLEHRIACWVEADR